MTCKKQIVRFLYRGALSDGEVFDTCLDEPHEVVLGRGRVMKPLEQALANMVPGEERTVEIPTEDAYGAYDEDAVQVVPACKVPHGSSMPVGSYVNWFSPRSLNPVPAKVVARENEVITLDFNHPLAGRDLVYWVKLVSTERF